VRWPDALPQYTLGHLDRLARIARRLAAHPGLAIAGNTDRGIGIPDCIASADAAVAIVRRHVDSLRLAR
jgi:oxygen-dependent protoporphyrinogen oxidase